MLALASTFTFAATTTGNPLVDDSTDPTELGSNGKTVKLISKVNQQALVFELQANTEGEIYVDLEDNKYLQNAAWDISNADINQKFRINAKARLFNETPITLTFTVSKFEDLMQLVLNMLLLQIIIIKFKKLSQSLKQTVLVASIKII